MLGSMDFPHILSDLNTKRERQTRALANTTAMIEAVTGLRDQHIAQREAHLIHNTDMGDQRAASKRPPELSNAPQRTEQKTKL